MDVAKNYQITTLINLLLTLLHSQPLSRSAFLTEYVTFQPCVQSITRSRRRTYKYACHLFKKRGGSCLVCFNARYTRDSFFSPPPSLPSPSISSLHPSLPSFSLPSFRPPQVLRLFASLKVQRLKRKRQVSVHST